MMDDYPDYGQQDLDEDLDEDAFDYEEECDAEEEALQNCGMMHDGSCMAAGSEECDWECPFGPLHNPRHWKDEPTDPAAPSAS